MPDTRKLSTIVFADIAGYTSLMQSDEEKAMGYLKAFKDELEKSVSKYEGNIVQYFGDASLLSFDSPSLAIKCAIELQTAYQNEGIPIRMGLHLGEVIFTDDNVFGDGVNIASRIESAGIPGAVLISKAVEDQIKNKTEIETVPLGEFQFKNVNNPVSIYAVSNDTLIVPRREQMRGKFKTPNGPKKVRQSIFTGKRIAVGLVVIIIFSTVAWFLNQQNNIRHWNTKGLADIIELKDSGQNKEAFEMINKARKWIPESTSLDELSDMVSMPISLKTDPPGARVYHKELGGENDWQFIGETPLDGSRIYRGEFLWKFELEGYDPVIRLNEFAFGIPWNDGYDIINLIPSDQIPEGMVHIPPSEMSLALPGIAQKERTPVPEFYLDRFEVTNKEFREFVVAGGYSSKEYWDYPFFRNGEEISFEEAMSIFVDKSNRPGPSQWQVSDYPEGEDDFPVGGVSWYEAQAYAKFVGKELPTVYHNNIASSILLGNFIIPYSNFSNIGVQEVGTNESYGAFGTFDLIGNLREWQYSGVDESNLRFALGGAWNEPFHAAHDALAVDPFSRSGDFGFRCMKRIDTKNDINELKQPIESIEKRDVKLEPIGEELYASFLRQFEYDSTPLNAQEETLPISHEDYTCEKVTIDAAYGDEKIDVYCFLPKNMEGPFDPVVVFPGASVLYIQEINPEKVLKFLPGEFIVKSGRAVIFPVYKSTFHRRDGTPDGFPRNNVSYKDHVIQWTKDFRRTVDYLESRTDINSDKIAYFGASWGGIVGGIIPAVEKRIKAVILIVGGLTIQKSMPEVDQLNYLPRINQPFLMLNGKYDFIFPYKDSQLPMFNLLGTPLEDKRHVLSETTHRFPNDELIKETLTWLDKYLATD